MFEVAPIGALVEEEARRVARREVEFEAESVFANMGLEGERGVSLEEDGVRPVLIFPRKNPLEDAIWKEVVRGKDFGELIREGLDSLDRRVVEDDIVTEEVDPARGHVGEAQGIGFLILKGAVLCWGNPHWAFRLVVGRNSAGG